MEAEALGIKTKAESPRESFGQKVKHFFSSVGTTIEHVREDTIKVVLTDVVSGEGE